MWTFIRWTVFVIAVLFLLAHFESLGSALGQLANGIVHVFTGLDGGVPENLLYHHDEAVQMLVWGVLAIWLLGMWIVFWKNYANNNDSS